MPDFTMQPSFPIASVIDAAQRKAQLEQEVQQQGNKSLVEGLQSIGKVGQDLVDKRLQVAQALALGKQFGIPGDQARLMTPEQVTHVGNIKKSNVDMRSLLLSMHPDLANNKIFMGSFGDNATAGETASTPAAQPTNGAILASNSTATPFEPPAAPAPLTPPTNGQTPVPIQAPPTMPRTVNKATADMAMKAYLANKQEPVVTRSQAEAQGGVSHGTHILPDQLEVSDKKDQFMQREWDKLLKESDPLNASSRTPLGLASRATFQANRALKTLSNPVVTNQEAGNAMADIAAIYQNGSPTQFGMSHQEYQTAYGKIQGVLQAISGKPQDALPDAIKNRLIGVVNDMKATNSALLKQRLDMTEHSKKAVINHFPQEWKEYRDILEGDQGGYNGLGATGTQSTGLPQVGDAYNGGKVLSIKRIK